MTELWLAWLAIIAGFVGLIWSADRFVAGSAAIANNFGVSRLIIGLTIVSLGTSAPEIIVSISASLQGSGELAIGNALGSNIANIGLVLAITALIAPMPIQKHLITQEIPILLLVTAAAGGVLYDAALMPIEGILLLACLIPLLYFMVRSKKSHPEEIDISDEIPDMKTLIASFWFVVGLAVLIGSSEMLVWGAQIVAIDFGVSPLIIGLTVIAVGTSLPELAASVVSAIKGHHEMALGNIIGSNIFNILTVMSLPAIIHPPTMTAEVFSRDFTAMAAITLLLAAAIVVDYLIRNRHPESHGVARLGRRIGCLLLASYIGYYYLLFT
ncbi:calcium/sodium antiporter [Aestuariicella hydrocarbonica]|uniref:Calcium/sodium antiporter n=1 Tax=Pseudomaricurvus hydrocarbonicus TaxID=1470433 RepID=A0A9E5JTH5_9GAMM|nr:calcium/sodium antiporter [Aestuariicella hydrocarbonica]NHO64305.1 calcium/sodium antiporter [Aestuariicella hydrocarbonica]